YCGPSASSSSSPACCRSWRAIRRPQRSSASAWTVCAPATRPSAGRPTADARRGTTAEPSHATRTSVRHTGLMDTEQLRALLTDVAAGRVDTEAALARLSAGPLGDGAGFVDLGYARVDTHRGVRTGDPEVVFAAGKTPAETVGIVAALRAASTGDGRPTLVTRASPQTV